MLHRAFLISVAILSSQVFADEPASQIRAPIPEEHTAKTPLQLTASFEIPTQTMLISTDEGRVDSRHVDQRIQYNPAPAPNIGIGAVYGPWAFGWSKRISSPGARTDYQDWRLALSLTEHIAVEGYYQDYHGFRADLSGQEGLQSSFGGNGDGATEASAAPQIVDRPDMEALNYGVRLKTAIPIWSLNGYMKSNAPDLLQFGFPNFGIALLTKIYYNRMGITGDSPLVPAARDQAFSPIASLRGIWTNTLGVGAGLGVSLPFTSNFKVGFDGMVGPGFQRQVDVFENSQDVHYLTAMEMNFNLFAEWTTQPHSFGFSLYLDNINSKVHDVNLDLSSLGVNFSYSYSGIYL